MGMQIVTWLVPLVAIGIGGGVLTTVSGFGGGLVVLLGLAVLVGAKPALVLSSLALLVGNTHRAWFYRGQARTDVLRPLALGLVPASVVGAISAVAVPVAVVHALMTVLPLVAVACALGGWRIVLPRRALVASGAIIGGLAATSGGAGLLVGPLLLAAGLGGEPYLATIAAISVVMHGSRLVGYAVGGLVAPWMLRDAAVVGVALVIGNLVGDRVRASIGARTQRAVEVLAPAIAAALALAGVG